MSSKLILWSLTVFSFSDLLDEAYQKYYEPSRTLARPLKIFMPATESSPARRMTSDEKIFFSMTFEGAPPRCSTYSQLRTCVSKLVDGYNERNIHPSLHLTPDGIDNCDLIIVPRRDFYKVHSGTICSVYDLTTRQYKRCPTRFLFLELAAPHLAQCTTFEQFLYRALDEDRVVLHEGQFGSRLFCALRFGSYERARLKKVGSSPNEQVIVNQYYNEFTLPSEPTARDLLQPMGIAYEQVDEAKALLSSIPPPPPPPPHHHPSISSSTTLPPIQSLSLLPPPPPTHATTPSRTKKAKATLLAPAAVFSDDESEDGDDDQDEGRGVPSEALEFTQEYFPRVAGACEPMVGENLGRFFVDPFLYSLVRYFGSKTNANDLNLRLVGDASGEFGKTVYHSHVKSRQPDWALIAGTAEAPHLLLVAEYKERITESGSDRLKSIDSLRSALIQRCRTLPVNSPLNPGGVASLLVGVLDHKWELSYMTLRRSLSWDSEGRVRIPKDAFQLRVFRSVDTGYLTSTDSAQRFVSSVFLVLDRVITFTPFAVMDRIRTVLSPRRGKGPSTLAPFPDSVKYRSRSFSRTNRSRRSDVVVYSRSGEQAGSNDVDVPDLVVVKRILTQPYQHVACLTALAHEKPVPTLPEINLHPDGQFFVEPLYEPLSSLGELTPSGLARLIRDVGEALDHLHTQVNYLHLDLKLDNIMYDSKTKRFVVIDFSHSRMVDALSPAITSQDCMPQEQRVEKVPLQPACDYYALGKVVHKKLLDWDWNTEEEEEEEEEASEEDQERRVKSLEEFRTAITRVCSDDGLFCGDGDSVHLCLLPEGERTEACLPLWQARSKALIELNTEAVEFLRGRKRARPFSSRVDKTEPPAKRQKIE